MSDLEIQLCKILTTIVANKLNEISAGLVNFEVDEYFITNTIGPESFNNVYNKRNYYIYANNIREIPEETLDEYRSVLTTVPFDMDFEIFHKIHNGSGNGTSKYACIYWESVILSLLITYTQQLEALLDPSFFYWDDIAETYIHEFTHTAEMLLPHYLRYDYHEALGKYYNGFYTEDDIIITAKYLFNQLETEDGQKIGIPYEFWKDEIYFNITFIEGEGGHIEGNLNQRIKLDRKAETVVAIPDFGYRFVGWSDNHKDAEYTIKSVRSDKTITAIFEEITQIIVFTCTNQDIVSKMIKNVIVTYKDFLTAPLYVPQVAGYEFHGWFLDKDTYTQQVGDKYGNVTEADYDKIFTKETRIWIWAKFTKI